MNVQPDSTSCLADHGTIFKSFVYTLDGIILHANEEAGAQLRMRRPSIEKGWRGMSEIAFGH